VQKGWDIEKWNEAEMAYTLNSATVGAMGGKLKSGMELKWLTKGGGIKSWNGLKLKIRNRRCNGWGNQKVKWSCNGLNLKICNCWCTTVGAMGGEIIKWNQVEMALNLKSVTVGAMGGGGAINK
jgi:hypothetical protein